VRDVTWSHHPTAECKVLTSSYTYTYQGFGSIEPLSRYPATRQTESRNHTPNILRTNAGDALRNLCHHNFVITCPEDRRSGIYIYAMCSYLPNNTYVQCLTDRRPDEKNRKLYRCARVEYNIIPAYEITI